MTIYESDIGEGILEGSGFNYSIGLGTKFVLQNIQICIKMKE